MNNEVCKGHGGARKGAGRPKGEEVKTPFRVTSEEKKIIKWLRLNPNEVERLQKEIER